VNELGVAEPIIAQQGINRIVVQLPGVQDTARAKEILGSVATLEFRLVDEQADPYSAKENNQAPAGDRLYQERNGNPILLKQRVMLTGDYIQDASSGIEQQNGRPAVYITLDGKGARLWSKVTGDNVQKLMAVVFITSKPDTVLINGQVTRTKRTIEEVINVARIQEQLSKRFQITGLENTREARNLALLLRAGALAAPMDIVEERTVGPSLGQQNIERGIHSAMLGYILVVIFMAVYYRLFGLIADLALFGNLVVLVGVLSMIPGATLTLPGIAGIVLTLGMAVDANVLINERIREELRNGNSPQAAINAGYEKAFNTILDSNVTALIAGIVLFAFGTGPVKGFAVTLSLGIVTSMFTAIMGTRAVVNLVYGRKKQPVLSI
jgi:preprotein translocase subunit SecD